MSIRTVRPDDVDSQGHIKLDMRVSDKLSEDLAAEITGSIESTQRFILSPLPDILVVTQQQFASLNAYTQKMHDTEDRMYITPWNVMEVIIDREINTDQEIESVMLEVDHLKQEIHDHESNANRETDGESEVQNPNKTDN